MATTSTYPLVWDLDALLPSPHGNEFAALLRQFRQRLEQLATAAESLPPVSDDTATVTAWSKFLAEYSRVETLAEDLESFVACHAAADAENKDLQRMEARLAALQPLREQTDTNLQFALKDASDEVFARFRQANASLQQLEYFLRRQRRHAEVRLPKDQERLANELAVDGIHAWGRLYDRISGALRVAVMERGELTRKSVGQVQFDSAQRVVRENNFFAANRAWDEIADTCADALNHISGTRLTLYRHLGLADHLDVPCRLNRMRRETLDAMWSAVTARKSCLSPYLQAKANAMGLEQLSWYDLAAPFPGGGRPGESEVTYADACDTVIDAFGKFSPDFSDFARHAIESGWIEAENRPGKRQGGFCTDFPGPRQTRIFMTWTNSVDSMSTLAHELGHAYHSFVLKNEPLVLRRYPMNLAETASTFAEAVLGEQRLANSPSDNERRAILDNMLADAVAFLMNIHARFLFEHNFHLERSEGEVPASRLSQLMLDAQHEAYQNSLADDGWNPSFWISKLHFYISQWPFYNFPYTFGYLLSLGLYALGSEGEADFPGMYRRLLLETGRQDTEDAVQSTFGYDLTDASFWNRALDVVEGRVGSFLELVD